MLVKLSEQNTKTYGTTGSVFNIAARHLSAAIGLKQGFLDGRIHSRPFQIVAMLAFLAEPTNTVRGS